MTAASVEVRAARFVDLDTTTLYEILRLRADVFVVEQGAAYADLDGRDRESATVHLWIEDAGVPVSYLRVLEEPELGGSRIGRVVTAAAWRHRGLAGTLIVEALRTWCDEPVWLEAQAHLAEWYGRFGFAVCGAGYLEDGIPHVPMVRRDRVAGRRR